MTRYVIGIDVSHQSGCACAVLDRTDGRVVKTVWLRSGNERHGVIEMASHYQNSTFAIDAPRTILKARREWYWRRRGGWRRRRAGESGRGRHCEVVIKAYGIANPQWTPVFGEETGQEWMSVGFALFSALEGRADTLEVFPSASYRMLDNQCDVRVDIPLTGFLDGPKDMLDAVVAAVTGAEFLSGNGQEVGGGDGLGTIVLPRGLPTVPEDQAAVLAWPG